MIEMIVAMAKNRVIGKDNAMLWHIREDFKHFKETTMGHPIIMGRKTWESIGRPLPGRKNVVITRSKNYEATGATVVGSLEEALAIFGQEERVFIIGGGAIYREALPMADVLWITEIDQDFEGDTTFPVIETKDWHREALSALMPTEERPYKVVFARFDRQR